MVIFSPRLRISKMRGKLIGLRLAMGEAGGSVPYGVPPSWLALAADSAGVVVTIRYLQ